jgi:hypothetical protein
MSLASHTNIDQESRSFIVTLRNGFYAKFRFAWKIKDELIQEDQASDQNSYETNESINATCDIE